MNDTAFWIWLLRTLGPAAAIADIVNYFGSPRFTRREAPSGGFRVF